MEQQLLIIRKKEIIVVHSIEQQLFNWLKNNCSIDWTTNVQLIKQQTQKKEK